MPSLDLNGKTAQERAVIKSDAISRTAPGNFERKSYTIDVQSIEKIDGGGIQVFARIWRNGTQVGFGDGTVDIERFRIFNPPILVPDPSGDIVRVIEGNEELGTQRCERRFREDPKEAILQTLEHTISVMSLHDDKRIQTGKIGSTVTTFYPAAGANSPADGAMASEGSSSSWTTLQQAAAGTSAGATEATFEPSAVAAISGIGVRAYGTGWAIARGIVNFDTSSLSGQVVSSATLSLYGRTGVVRNDKNTGNDFIIITPATPAATNAITTADFDMVGNVANPSTGAYSSGIDVGSISDSAYNDFALNATGLAAINLSGVTSMGIREGDDANTAPTGWVNGDRNNADFYTADQSGTTNDPKLVVTHSAGGAPTARRLSVLGVGS